MPSQYRTVTIAAGHSVTVRLSRQQTARPGYVRVEKSHRAPFEIPESAWQQAATRPSHRIPEMQGRKG